MANENGEQKKLMDRLRETYRLVIMHNETFQELGSYKLSLLSVYTAISSAAVLLTVVVVSLIVFTPLKRYIPGYGETNQFASLMELSDKVDNIEDEMKAHQTYANNFKKMLTADVQTKDEMPVQDVNIPDSLLNIDKIEEDKTLRSRVESDKINTVSANGATVAKTVNFSPRDIPLEQIYFLPPVTGQVSRGLDLKGGEPHHGVDILAPKNTPIKSALDGYVIMADFTVATGNTIGIMHSNNIVTYYKHCSGLLKKVGNYVKAGEAIAIIGNTGAITTGPHLHFELWHKGKAVDATEYINFN